MASYELISLNICPFVQRSVITLRHKQIDFNVRYVDLKSPPQWFLDISPLAKVPVLKVDDTPLFESAVINEYLDEVTGGGMLPADPLHKAQCRAWIEFASELIVSQYLAMLAGDEPGFREKLQQIREQLRRLQQQVQTPFFIGEQFTLVDTSYAPFFMRHAIMEELLGEAVLADYPQVKQWSDNILALAEVQQSVPQDFKRLFLDYFQKESSWLAQRAQR